MEAKYNHWYPTEKGTMPEDFENCFDEEMYGENCTIPIVCYHDSDDVFIDYREYWKVDKVWKWSYTNRIAPIHYWMLPNPHKQY